MSWMPNSPTAVSISRGISSGPEPLPGLIFCGIIEGEITEVNTPSKLRLVHQVLPFFKLISLFNLHNSPPPNRLLVALT